MWSSGERRETIIAHAREALEAFTPIMRAWGLEEEDYFITGRLNLAMLGYPTPVKESGNDIVFGARQGKLPWFSGEPHLGFQETPPPLHSQYEEVLNEAIARLKIGIHFYTFSDFYFLRQREHCDRFILPGGTSVLLTNLFGSIQGTAETMLPQCTEDGVGLEKGVRMLEFIRKNKQVALDRGEEATARRADQALEEFAWMDEEYKKVCGQTSATATSDVIRGRSVVPGVVRGVAWVMDSHNGTPPTSPALIVAERISPKWYQWKENMQALVIDHGGMLGHAAVLARELKIPTIIQTIVGTQKIKTGDTIEVDAGEGVVRIIKRNV